MITTEKKAEIIEAAAEALSAVLEAQRMPSRKNILAQHEAEHNYILVLEEALNDDPWTEEDEDNVITISRAEYDELIATKTKFELAKARAAESGYRDAVDRMLYDLAESPEGDCKTCDGTCECGKTLCPKL